MSLACFMSSSCLYPKERDVYTILNRKLGKQVTLFCGNFGYIIISCTKLIKKCFILVKSHKKSRISSVSYFVLIFPAMLHKGSSEIRALVKWEKERGTIIASNNPKAGVKVVDLVNRF